jgi:hypothetical protein
MLCEIGCEGMTVGERERKVGHLKGWGGGDPTLNGWWDFKF